MAEDGACCQIDLDHSARDVDVFLADFCYQLVSTGVAHVSVVDSIIINAVFLRSDVIYGTQVSQSSPISPVLWLILRSLVTYKEIDCFGVIFVCHNSTVLSS